MAGDWIKFEHTTPDKPEVVKMATALKIDQDAVVGKLLRVWLWADANSLNGECVGVTEAFIDRLTCRRGFAAAMRSVGWLVGNDGEVSFTNFSRHNGATAKARAVENRRKSDYRDRTKASQKETEQSRECPKDSGTNTGTNTDEKRGPEKRREEYNTIAPGAKPPARARDVLFDALAIAEGSDPKQLTAPAAKKIGVALAQIKAVSPDVGPSEIQSRARAYRRLYPTAALTAMALAGHWAKLGGSAPRQVDVAEAEPEGWRAYWRDTYPPEDFPDAPRYDEGEWKDVRADHKREIREGMRKKGQS